MPRVKKALPREIDLSTQKLTTEKQQTIPGLVDDGSCVRFWLAHYTFPYTQVLYKFLARGLFAIKKSEEDIVSVGYGISLIPANIGTLYLRANNSIRYDKNAVDVVLRLKQYHSSATIHRIAMVRQNGKNAISQARKGLSSNKAFRLGVVPHDKGLSSRIRNALETKQLQPPRLYKVTFKAPNSAGKKMLGVKIVIPYGNTIVEPDGRIINIASNKSDVKDLEDMMEFL